MDRLNMTIESQNNASVALIQENAESRKVSIKQAVKNYYSRAFKFKLKATRTEYAVGVGFQWIMSVVYVFIVAQIVSASGNYEGSLADNLFLLGQWIFWVVIYLPSFALTFRRSRDAVGGTWLAWMNYLSTVAAVFFYTTALTMAWLNFQISWMIYASIALLIVTGVASVVFWLMLLFKVKKESVIADASEPKEVQAADA